MKRDLLKIAAALAGLAFAAPRPSAAADDSVERVRADLNATRSVLGSEDIKSYPVVFEAYLALTPPPMAVGPAFNQNTIHPGMPEWTKVSGWAESNPKMAEAIRACEEKTLFGLPYTEEDVKTEFREAGLVVRIGVDGSLRDNEYPYLDAIGTIATFATAESYRLLEAGKYDDGIDLAVAMIFLVRQCCDREMLDEQLRSITLLNDLLANLRDMFYVYRGKISHETCAEIAIHKLPYLRPDRSRLLIAEGDKRVAAALLDEVFDENGQADREKFPDTFAAIQARDKPLTRFGAARRWRMIAEVHDSEEDSRERLTRVYDDWWRRWRVEAYDPILEVRTQFEQTNPVRYAAVIYSLQDIRRLFTERNELLASVYGSSVAIGLCGYKQRLGTYPDDQDKLHATYSRKRSDLDPFDVEGGTFKYRVLDGDFVVDTPYGRVHIDKGECILYSLGQDHVDDRGGKHTDEGTEGDIVLWPPMKALAREQKLID